MIKVDARYVREVCDTVQEVLTIWELYRKGNRDLRLELSNSIHKLVGAMDQKEFQFEDIWRDALKHNWRDALKSTYEKSYINSIEFNDGELTTLLRSLLTRIWHVQLSDTWERKPIKIDETTLTPDQAMEAMRVALDALQAALDGRIGRQGLSPKQREILKAFDAREAGFWHKDIVAEWVNVKPGSKSLEADLKTLADTGYLDRVRGKGTYHRTPKPIP